MVSTMSGYCVAHWYDCAAPIDPVVQCGSAARAKRREDEQRSYFAFIVSPLRCLYLHPVTILSLWIPSPSVSSWCCALTLS